MLLLSQEDCANIKSVLCNYIQRVADGNFNYPEEVSILPDIVRLTVGYFGDAGNLPILEP